MNLVLFPNQLFEPKIIKKVFPNIAIENIYFIEDPTFYGKRKGSGAVSSLQLNQLRILYMYITHQRYLQQLKPHYNITYIPIQQLWKNPDISFLPKECLLIDPCDLVLMKKLQSTKVQWTIADSPSFVLTASQLQDYQKDRAGKRLQHSSFYNFSKEVLHILKGVKSQDIYNRQPYSKKISLPPNPYHRIYSNEKEWEQGLEWLNSTPFRSNPKPSKDWDTIINSYLIHLPLTTKDVRLWMKDFIHQRLSNYGKYQDVVILSQPLLNHSGLSIYLNNGLITPIEVVEAVSATTTDITNKEGFIRQVIGWREYCRLYYLYVSPKQYRKNIFGHTRKALSKAWYLGNTEVPFVNETIQYAFNYGYLNHIQRLMVMSNYMTLNGFHADAIYKWMYEFSLDSYEWVMVFNCYSMGSWSDGGFAMRKPYISSSNYLLKMVEHQDKDWVDHWDQLYQAFLKKHASILKHTQLANLISK
jgi:deoxyribodipyrimidine photolyase-related protein